DAVHPGYGFLAENAGFAAACRTAGLVFIGPSPEAITAMGDKAGAKALMAAAGVAVVPGYQGEDQSAARLAREAAAIGWPVMVKATAGGGGRGMRKVDAAAEFAEALRSAQSEALSAFGDATVILERALIAPRHIEIQVFADRHGNAIHLGERDCSVQRRHQKLIEEAPSPAVSAELRERMGAVAVKAVLAIAYEGAGTLEFLLDAKGDFFFMEMNTRLQVEHPVTEAITGLDLVDWQLRVAAGEALPLSQDQVRFSGHAIEVRLCAEDALQQFMPQSGSMAAWAMPEALRVEHALRAGDEIAPYYDSMIAKLVAHGASRAEALRKLQRGLQDAVALGVTTNQAFLSRCLAHPVFGQGGATTAFIADHQVDLLHGLTKAGDAEGHRSAAALAALLLHLSAAAGASVRDGLMHRMPMLQRFKLDGVACQGTLSQTGPLQFSSQLDGETCSLVVVADTHAPGAGQVRVQIDGLAQTVAWQRDGATLRCHFAGRAWNVLDTSRAAAAQAGGKGQHGGKLRASMNGRVVALLAAVGDTVSAGQPLLTLEAMKMEHVHGAPCAGRVVALHVGLGEQVAAHRVLVEVEVEVEAVTPVLAVAAPAPASAPALPPASA
ncbi:MAG: ATP-grasp domain-containing protein, partial [Microbacteriaceae bacterium]|nr:ATP-grasp domain-containing protein [Burkholderiaceae bacterium]